MISFLAKSEGFLWYKPISKIPSWFYNLTKSRVTRMYISAPRNFEYSQKIAKKAQNRYW